MKRTISTFILTLACAAATAQNTWTLDSCVSYAVSHANSVRRSRIELTQSHSDARTAALDFLPTVSGQVSGQYAWGRNVDPETNTYNTITTFNNYYTVEASVSSTAARRSTPSAAPRTPVPTPPRRCRRRPTTRRWP